MEDAGSGRHVDNGDFVTAGEHRMVEAVVTDDPITRRLRIHRIAYHATPQSSPAKDRPYVLSELIENMPMFRANTTVADRIRQVTTLNCSTPA